MFLPALKLAFIVARLVNFGICRGVLEFWMEVKLRRFGSLQQCQCLTDSEIWRVLVFAFAKFRKHRDPNSFREFEMFGGCESSERLPDFWKNFEAFLWKVAKRLENFPAIWKVLGDATPCCWGIPYDLAWAEVMPTIDELKKLIKTHEATKSFCLALKMLLQNRIAANDNDGFYSLL